MKRWLYHYENVHGAPDRLARTLRRQVRDLLRTATGDAAELTAEGDLVLRLPAQVLGRDLHKTVRLHTGVALNSLADRTIDYLTQRLARALEKDAYTDDGQGETTVGDRLLVRDVMTPDPLVLHEDTPIKTAALLLFHYDRGGSTGAQRGRRSGRRAERNRPARRRGATGRRHTGDRVVADVEWGIASVTGGVRARSAVDDLRRAITDLDRVVGVDTDVYWEVDDVSLPVSPML